jgi:hypothetical protein
VLIDSVPQEEPLQPAPPRLQVTAVFEVPVMLAVKSWVPAVNISALIGLMLLITGDRGTPFPARAIVVGAPIVPLSKERLPVAFPVVMGANLTLKWATCPGTKRMGNESPLRVKFPSVIITWETVS